MVVLAIISIMVLIGAPKVIDWYPRMKTKAAVNQLAGLMQKAKISAIKANRTSKIIFSPANESYTIFFDDGAAGNNWAIDADDTLLASVQMAQGVDLFDTNIPFNTYGYSSRGLTDPNIPLNTYYVRFLIHTNNYYAVRLIHTGNVAVVTSTDGGVTWF